MMALATARESTQGTPYPLWKKIAAIQLYCEVGESYRRVIKGLTIAWCFFFGEEPAAFKEGCSWENLVPGPSTIRDWLLEVGVLVKERERGKMQRAIATWKATHSFLLCLVCD